MRSKHKEAPAFIRRGFFEGLKSFSDFEARTEKLANTKEVGDAFEILVEAYLHLDSVLCVKEVWLVGDIPLKIRNGLNLPADSKGIDGVYEDTSGNLIPYQVKYRTDKDTLSYGDVSSFLGITEESLKDRVIITNARNLAADITKRKGLRSVRAAQFHDLTEEDFKRILAWLSDKKPEFKRWAPQPHQKEAIEKITAALKESDRTTAVMACGTGKTLVALWAAEAQDPKTILVLVPSLALLSQTLPDWCKQTSWGDRFRYLCVCSDASVDRSAKEDEYALKQSDLEFPVTTDANQVKAFAAGNKTGVNVIFSTYQSAEVVAEGLKGLAIDIGIFDEAHKTTGPKDGLFAFGLSDKNLRIKKRLFLTATPRHYDLRKRDKNGDYRTISMSDETNYGKVSYRLSFSAAVAARIIVPYKVIISVSLNKEVDAELLRRGSTLVRRNQIHAKWVANQIALKRAIEKTKASKIITFHSRVKLAEDFAGDDAQGFSEHCKGFEIFHVNGSQNAAKRKGLLDGFKSASKGLITNARCLTEGVDVPAVDMVAFVDPRKSRIDIAQAAGRAMRLSRATNKKLGYIVVPLFIEQKKGETESAALKRSGFDEVAMVLGAMLENDADLVDVIREMQVARGRGEGFRTRHLHEKVEVIGPTIDLIQLTNSIDIAILDRLGLSWDNYFGLLQKFSKGEGHCLVNQRLIVDGLKLGTWVSNQRSRKDQLTDDQIQRLTSLGFSWNPHDEKWEAGFSELQRFQKKHGHCRVSEKTKLGQWVKKQRHNKDKLTVDQVGRLDSIGFSWVPHAERWEKSFAVLQKFQRLNGHCRVGHSLVLDGIGLGAWILSQRQQKHQLTDDQIRRLNYLKFSWDPMAEDWEESFAALKNFRKLKGHCRVAHDFKINGLRLGSWVGYQRSRKNQLSQEQVRRLNSIGFIWDSSVEQWERAFAELVKFRKRKGHCRVAQRHIVNSIKIGSWVTRQRHTKSQLSAEYIKRLDSLGFSWDPMAEDWEESFAALKNFRKLKGHCRVAHDFKINGLRLGSWVGYQRSRKNQLKPDQIKRLNSIGFIWDPLSEQWEKGFTALQRFNKSRGHCRPPQGLVINGIRLSRWASMQRQTKKRLTTDQVKRLDSIGFSWDLATEQWEEFFTALQKLREVNGHCRVTQAFTMNGIKIGNWVVNQRSRKDRLSPEQIKRLDSLGFSWDPLSEKWEEFFSKLQKFRNDHGHCRVAQRLVIDGLKLGTWVNVLRTNRNRLSPDQVKRIDSLGFSWDQRAEQWEQGFVELMNFKKATGHCKLPSNLVVRGFKLGSWVVTQRHRKDRLSPERINRLNSVGFQWRGW